MDAFRCIEGFSSFILGALLVTGCGAPGIASGVDADVSDSGSDGGSIDINLDSGMGLVFVIKRSLPSEHDRNGYKFNLESAQMSIMNLRLVADSVAGGDERTTLEFLEGEWSDEHVSVPVLYPDAPPGLYSHIRGTVVEFEVSGAVQLSDNNFYDLDIDIEALSVPFETSVERDLEIGTPLVLEVEFDLREVIDEINFDDLAIIEGDVVIGDGPSQAMDKIQEKLRQAFKVVGEFSSQGS